MNIDLNLISDELGYVDASKIEGFLKKFHEENVTQAKKFSILKAIGYNRGSGMLASDFIRRYIFVKTFIDLDKDGSGYLDREEVREFIGTDCMSSEEFQELFKDVDINGDGKISIEELLCYLETEIKLSDLIKI